MPIRDDIPRPKQSHAEPVQRTLEISGHDTHQFQDEFFTKLQEAGLQIDRDVVLSMTPIGKPRADEAESFLVKVTFTAGAMDTQRTPRSKVLDVMDLLDQYDTRQQSLEH